jgi:hypothetical protein
MKMNKNEFYKDLYQKGMDILLEKVEAWERAYNELEEDLDDLIEKNKELTKELREYKEQHDSEHKFKIGDKIKFVGRVYEDEDDDMVSNNSIVFNSYMQDLLDSKPRQILDIDYDTLIDNTFHATIDGIKGTGWLYHENDFEKVE